MVKVLAPGRCLRDHQATGQLASHTGKQTKYLFQRLELSSSSEHQHMLKEKLMGTRILMDNLSLSCKHGNLSVYLHIESITCDIRNLSAKTLTFKSGLISDKGFVSMGFEILCLECSNKFGYVLFGHHMSLS